MSGRRPTAVCSLSTRRAGGGRRRTHRWLTSSGLVAFAALLGCEPTPITEIVLIVDTDIVGADTLRVDASYPSGRSAVAEADLSTQPAPRRLVLVHRGGELGPVELSIAALTGSDERVVVRRDVWFEPEETLTLTVFLSRGCVTRDCGEETCANDGACRSATVDPCEYRGRICPGTDAGPIDGSTPEGGAPDGGVPPGDSGSGCDLGAICGLVDVHLPGDRIQPALCDALPEPVVVSVMRDGTLLTGGPEWLLAQPGPHAVRVERESDPSCGSDRVFTVAGPSGYEDSTTGRADPLRDLDAAVNAAFVAGQLGAYAVDDSGWTVLDTGTVLDFQASAAHALGGALFGPVADLDLVSQIDASGPFPGPAATSIALGDGNFPIRALGRASPALGPAALLTADGIVTLEFSAAGSPTVTRHGPPRDGQWVAIGMTERADLGRVWAGTTTDLWNVSFSARGAFSGGAPRATPADLGDIRAAAVGEGPAGPRLWLCGELGVAVVPLEGASDWTALIALPMPLARYDIPCFDVAVGRDGHAWVAAFDRGVVRLDELGAERLRYGGMQGLIGVTRIDRIAFAEDGTNRALWLLDTGARLAIRYRASAWP